MFKVTLTNKEHGQALMGVPYHMGHSLNKHCWASYCRCACKIIIQRYIIIVDMVNMIDRRRPRRLVSLTSRVKFKKIVTRVSKLRCYFADSILEPP